MTTLAEAMYAYLQTFSWGDRVYPWRLPKDVPLPAIAFQIIPSAGPVRVHSDAHDASLPVESLFMVQRVQWDVWGSSYLETDRAAVELRHGLQAFQGYMGDLYIGSVLIDIDLDSYEEEIGVYRRIIDGMVRFNEVIAVAS